MVSNASSSGVSAASSTKTKGILSLVFGIVSLAFFFIPLIGLLFGIAAVVLGFLSRKSEPAANTLALWGIILGFAGIAVSIVMFIINAMLVAQLVGSA
jgi:hypothetical protein